MLKIKGQKRDPLVPPINVATLFDISCIGHKNDVVVNQKEYNFTRADLKRDQLVLARAFCRMGVTRGDIITVATGRSMYDLLVIFLAANRLGAIVAFMDEKMSQEDLVRYLHEFNSTLLITYHWTEERINSIRQALALPIPVINLTVDLDHCNFNQTVLETFKLEGRSIMETARQQVRKTPVYRFNAKDEALISFTSGSTSGPKPMVFTNESLIADAIYSKFASGIKMWDKELHSWMGYVRLDCPYGLVVSVLAPLFSGGKLVMTPDINDSNLNYYIGKNSDVILGVPPLLEALPEVLDPATDISNLKMFITGGDRLEAETSRKAMEFFKSRGATNAKICNGYGVGESLGFISTAIGDVAYNPDSVGVIPAGVHVMVIDAKTGKELGFNETGFIFFNGKHMMKRYFNRPELTEKKIITSLTTGKKFIDTGDLGYISEDGYLTLVGRATFFINNVPAKVYYEVVRTAISKSDLVKKCYVVKGPDHIYKLGAYAFVVLKDGVEPDEEVRRAIVVAASEPFMMGSHKITLKPYEKPRRIIFLDDFPLTRANKTDFQKLEEMAKEMGPEVDDSTLCTS